MTTRTETNRTYAGLLALTILIIALAGAAPAKAGAGDGECRYPHAREGWLVGGNAGWGSTSYGAKVGSRTFTDEAYGGGYGALRAGYAFSDAFAVTLEGFGFGRSGEGEDDDWGLGGGFATVTWFPSGGGFFVRGGLGVGGGEVKVRETGEIVAFDGKAAGLFGIGYEWRVGRDLGLGVAADAFGFHLDGASGLEDDSAGTGGLSIQLNWYL